MRAEPAEPLAAESVMTATSLRLPKPVMDGVRHRARERGLKPTAVMREWTEAAVADPGGSRAAECGHRSGCAVSAAGAGGP
ncbi:hypothetical protein ACIPLC_09810 [Kitasatospora sp. NPDC086801]|uniref:hypothetical protein n=1 Tax=Kitasatospora sp. NPDC086801 TaxID=3364066 RepID=UPI003803516C